jgi:hypothetical protein
VNLVTLVKGVEMNDELAAFLTENPFMDVKVIAPNGG